MKSRAQHRDMIRRSAKCIIFTYVYKTAAAAAAVQARVGEAVSSYEKTRKFKSCATADSVKKVKSKKETQKEIIEIKTFCV